MYVCYFNLLLNASQGLDKQSFQPYFALLIRPYFRTHFHKAHKGLKCLKRWCKFYHHYILSECLERNLLINLK